MVILQWLLIQFCTLIFAVSANIIAKQASRGDWVKLTFETNKTYTVQQVNWVKEGYSYAYYNNQTISNFSAKFQIHPNYPLHLSIPDFQENDTGIYRCDLMGENGVQTMQWNVTLNEETATKDLLVPLIYTLSTVGGLLLIFTSAVCLSRICRSSNQDTGQDQTVFVRTEIQPDEEGRPQDGSGDQYVERLNSIYALRR